MRLLLVEDDRITRLPLSDALEREGYEVRTCEEASAGVTAAREGGFDIVVTDLRLPGGDGMAVLRAAHAANPRCDVIVITAYGTVDTAVEALKAGAYDYVTKPLDPDKFLAMLRHIRQFRSVEQENSELRRRLDQLQKRAVIGEAPVMRRLLERVRHVATHDATVLIEGESGTGKEVIARSLHEWSARSDRPFIAINCAAIPESLLESELFGHEKGAFSGALQRHRGYFERANRGTIFLDDIDDLPLAPQVKLLRVLQERSFGRLGGTDVINVDVRVICATKVDLMQLVREGRFREDLYYRVAIVPLQLPPLRERLEDVPLLVAHFLEKHGAPDALRRFDQADHDALLGYDWPGNVRELENAVQRMIATADTRFRPPAARTRAARPESNGPSRPADGTDPSSSPGRYPPFDEYMRARETEIITWAMSRSRNNVTRAARLLDMPRGTLRSRLERLGMQPADDETD
jgi:two-component system, NtrC family, response regulator AtoC